MSLMFCISGLCGLVNINLDETDTEYVNLTSPGFPANYPHEYTCQWFISIADSDNVIIVGIVFFDLEREFDFVIIGSDHDTTDDSSVITKLTGNI